MEVEVKLAARSTATWSESASVGSDAGHVLGDTGLISRQGTSNYSLPQTLAGNWGRCGMVMTIC
jgi:hypothetical protein